MNYDTGVVPCALIQIAAEIKTASTGLAGIGAF